MRVKRATLYSRKKPQIIYLYMFIKLMDFSKGVRNLHLFTLNGEFLHK